MKKAICLICFFIVLGGASAAQAPADSVRTDPEELPKEKVEGLWQVMGYLGGKLTDELGKRLNIEGEEKKGRPTEVQVEMGWIKFTRIEER